MSQRGRRRPRPNRNTWKTSTRTCHNTSTSMRRRARCGTRRCAFARLFSGVRCQTRFRAKFSPPPAAPAPAPASPIAEEDEAARALLEIGAKGLPEVLIRRRHILLVAAPPIVTGLILGLAATVGGSILIETVFACGGGTKNPVFLREHADLKSPAA